MDGCNVAGLHVCLTLSRCPAAYHAALRLVAACLRWAAGPLMDFFCNAGASSLGQAELLLLQLVSSPRRSGARRQVGVEEFAFLWVAVLPDSGQ